MTLPKSLPVNHHHKVWFWDDERNIGNSIIVTLVKGWEFGTDTFEKRHVEGFDNIKDAVTAVKQSVPCSCDACTH
jgi:hypothetical protein